MEFEERDGERDYVEMGKLDRDLRRRHNKYKILKFKTQI